MAGRKTDWDEQIFALGAPGSQAAIGDLVGQGRGVLKAAFITHGAVFGENALHDVAVDEEGAHANGVVLENVGLQILLHHDVFADHAAAFTHVQCVGPVGVVGEFVFAQAPGVCLIAQTLRHPFIMPQEPQHALDEVGMILPDACARGSISIGVGEVGAGIVGGEKALGIEVVFAIGDVAQMKQAAKADAREGVDQAQQQFVLGGVVVCGLGKGDEDVFAL